MQPLQEIILERKRQDAKWGEQNHSPHVWLTILTEEVGEFAQATLAANFGTARLQPTALEDMRREVIHIAAVAVAIAECIDRDKWRF